jgi:hypothetical protein
MGVKWHVLGGLPCIFLVIMEVWQVLVGFPLLNVKQLFTSIFCKVFLMGLFLYWSKTHSKDYNTWNCCRCLCEWGS